MDIKIIREKEDFSDTVIPKTGISAVILAGGTSSRMGTPKSMLPLGGRTVLEQVVHTFISAGVSDIRVVTGHCRESLQDIIARLPVYEVYNDQYQDGMYSSIQCGVRSVRSNASGFFIHPVDVPLISSRTINTLIHHPGFSPSHILCPEYGGKRGHPPLIGASFREEILACEPPFGLSGFLHSHADEIIAAEVTDPHIRINMNTPDDYRRVVELMRGLATDNGADIGADI